jgi:DNA replication protein DnaC
LSQSLPPLSDEEYDELSRSVKTSIPLDECPTCRARRIEVAPHVHGWINGTYKFKGQTFPCDCAQQMNLRKHYLRAGIGDQYMRLDWADYDGDDDLTETVALYLDKWENFRIMGMGLTLRGPQGSGKTFAATHIGKELIKRGMDVHFTSFNRVVGAYAKPNAEAIERKLQQTGLLILDELTPADSGPQAYLFARRFEELIRQRTDFNLPTIITTNLSDSDLLEEYQRAYSLLAAKQISLAIEQDDARRLKVAKLNLQRVGKGETPPIT